MVARDLRCQISKEKLNFNDLSSFFLEEKNILISQGKLKNHSNKSKEQAHIAHNTKKKGRPRCFVYSKKGHLPKACTQKKAKAKAKDKSFVKTKDVEKKSHCHLQLPSTRLAQVATSSIGVARATPYEGIY